MEDSHTKSVAEVLHYFKTDETTGLSDNQVKEGIEKYGPNGKSTGRFYNHVSELGLVD